jgi:hypothetical protein
MSAKDKTIQKLLNNSRDSNDLVPGPGYYGVFTANLHADVQGLAGGPGVGNAVTHLVDAATSEGVPVVSSKQLLDWLDARNATGFGPVRAQATDSDARVSWVLETEARGLTLLVPKNGANGKTLQALERDGAALPFQRFQLIKGVVYLWVEGAAPGHYLAIYQ